MLYDAMHSQMAHKPQQNAQPYPLPHHTPWHVQLVKHLKSIAVLFCWTCLVTCFDMLGATKLACLGLACCLDKVELTGGKQHIFRAMTSSKCSSGLYSDRCVASWLIGEEAFHDKAVSGLGIESAIDVEVDILDEQKCIMTSRAAETSFE